MLAGGGWSEAGTGCCPATAVALQSAQAVRFSHSAPGQGLACGCPLPQNGRFNSLSRARRPIWSAATLGSRALGDTSDGDSSPGCSHPQKHHAACAFLVINVSSRHYSSRIRPCHFAPTITSPRQLVSAPLPQLGTMFLLRDTSGYPGCLCFYGNCAAPVRL